MLSKRRHHEKHAEHEEAEIVKSLSAIYGDERDDLKVLTQGESWTTWFLKRVIVALGVVCIIVFGGFVTYTNFFAAHQEGKPLVMAFVAPDILQSGALATIELQYVNATAYPLTGVEIDINLPSGFVLRSSEPSATQVKDMIFTLGTIPGKTDGKIRINGVWNTDVPSTAGIQALARYKPANFNADFHDILTKTIVTNTSTTELRVDAPATVNVGEGMTYAVHVKNAGTETLVAPRVALTLPQGFFVQTSNPGLVPGEGFALTIGDIAPGAESLLALTGAFASDVTGEQNMTVVSGIAGERFSVQATAIAQTEVQGSALALTMVGNGTQGTVVADPGSLLRLALRIENMSDAPVSDATALLDFTAEDNLPIDWKAAVLAGGKVTAKGIIFDAKSIGTIAPGEYTTLDLAFPLKTDLSAVSSAFSIAFSVTRGAITVQSAPLSVVLNSDAALLSGLRYYDDDGAPLGSGPLPPMVGEVTHYRGVWSIASGAHGLNDVTVSAVLPEGVAWDDFVTATSGVLTFDPTQRIVRWTVSSIPASSPMITARFSVALTPTSADVGLIKTVVGKAVLTAKDSTTKATIERSTEAVTTECVGDVHAEGKGEVVKKI